MRDVFGWMIHMLVCSIAWRIGWNIVGLIPEWWMSGLAGMIMSLQWSRAQEDD